MAVKTKQELKLLFASGSTLTQSNFSDLIDSLAHHTEGLQNSATNLGIGTTQPQAPLSIALSGGKKTNPDASMHLSNDCILFGGKNQGQSINSAKIAAGSADGSENVLSLYGMTTCNEAGNLTVDRRVDIWAEGGLKIHGDTGGTTRMTVAANGNVGIGTASPGAKLEVNGDLKVNGPIHSNYFAAHTIFREVAYDSDSWKCEQAINFPANCTLIHHLHVSGHVDSAGLHTWNIKKGTNTYEDWETIQHYFNSTADHQHRSATFVETIHASTTFNRWEIAFDAVPDGNDWISWVIQVVPFAP